MQSDADTVMAIIGGVFLLMVGGFFAGLIWFII